MVVEDVEKTQALFSGTLPATVGTGNGKSVELCKDAVHDTHPEAFQDLLDEPTSDPQVHEVVETGERHAVPAIGIDHGDIERADTPSERAPLHTVFSKKRRNFIIFMAAWYAVDCIFDPFEADTLLQRRIFLPIVSQHLLPSPQYFVVRPSCI